MADFGQNFAAGFAATAQLIQAKEAMRQRQQELSLRNKLLELQFQDYEQKLRGRMALREALTPQPMPREGTALDLEQNPEAAGTQPGTKPLDLRQLALGLAQVDPDSAVKLLIDQERMGRQGVQMDKVLTLFSQMTGQVPGAPTATAAPEGAAVTAPTMPSPGGAAPPSAPAASGMQPPSAAAPSMSLAPTLSLDKEGNVSLSIAGKPTEFQLGHQTIVGPDGRAQVYETVFEPRTGRVVNRYPIGSAAAPEAMQKIEAAVESLGVARTAPIFGRLVGQVSMAMLLPPDVQAQRLAQIEQDVNALPPAVRTGATAAPAAEGKAGGAVSGAIRGAQQEKTLQVEADTRARERAQREEQPLQGADRSKYQMLLSVERGANRVLELFDPAFVGKGFGAFSADLKKQFEEQERGAPFGSNKYQPGAMAGAIREFTGKISPDEVEFRKSLLDMSDLLLRARSGAQINEQEYARLRGILANLFDEPNVFIPAMRRFRKEVAGQLDDVLKTATSSASGLRRGRESAPEPKAPRGGLQIRSITPVK